tara:strand:- start:103 stop:597 length:495 start_codon:yes stop_codon:yes gene_type:complete
MVKKDHEFYELAKLRKYKIQEVTKEDFRKNISHRLMGISKASKKEVSFSILLRRQTKPSKYSDNWAWVEFKKNRSTAGWIYGKADFVAFETRNEYVIISSKVLLHFLNTSSKIRYDLPFVKEPRYARYKIQKDKNGRESTQVSFRDLKKLKGVQIWKKKNERSA